MVKGNTIYLQPGTVLHAQYRVNGVIGQGGFGITYDGTDLNLNMHVAIKEYFPNPMATRQTGVSTEVICNTNTVDLYEKGMKNFLEEARIMAKYAGEDNFVAVHDYFAENNTAYIIMEFVEGENLKQYLHRCNTLTMDETMQIIIPVMNVLEKIHNKGMIHRDVSPSNIMILPDRRVRLLDFGAVKEISLETMNLTTMSSVYKQGYSPIEQLTQGLKQGPYTDIYALCATIYEMLTGSTPPSPFQRAYEGVELILPSRLGVKITPVQEEALLKGLEINGADRIQSIQELRAALCGAGQGEGSIIGVERDYNKIALIIAAGTAASAILIILVFFLYRFSTTHRKNKKEPDMPVVLNTSQEAEEEKQENRQDNIAIQEESSDQGKSSTSTGVETGAAIVINEGADDTNTEDDAGKTEDIVYPIEIPDAIYIYKGHSYAFYDANDYDLATYAAVSNFCKEQGGHLAVINDENENAFLYDLMTQNYDHTVFFGYSDENKEGKWQWDGDNSTYENWTTYGDWNLPDNGREWGGDEDYAEFNYDTIHDWSPRDGTWNDAPFMDNTSVFICEWEYELVMNN